jgi:hypothetical protein
VGQGGIFETASAGAACAPAIVPPLGITFFFGRAQAAGAATGRTAKAKATKLVLRGGAALVICADCDSRRAKQPCERALNTFIIVHDRDIDFGSVHTGRTRSSN